MGRRGPEPKSPPDKRVYVILVSRTELGAPHRLLPRRELSAPTRAKKVQTTSSLRYAQAFEDEAQARREFALRPDVAKKFKGVPTSFTDAEISAWKKKPGCVEVQAVFAEKV